MRLRALSGAERVFLVAHRLAPPFLTELCFEGEGEVGAGLEGALERTVEAHPMGRAVLRGVLGGTHWRAGGISAPLRVVAAPDWEGRGPHLALACALDPRRGPTAEVLLVRGARTRVIVRCLHVLSDGRGLLLFAADLFAALRGEAPRGAAAGPETDADLAHSLGVDPEGAVPRDAAPLLATGHPPTWARVTLDAPVSRPLHRLAVAVAARCPGRPVVDVPVDLRRHRPHGRTTANHTGLVRLRLEGAWDEDRVGAALLEATSRHDEARCCLTAAPLRRLPLALLVSAGRREAGAGQRTGAYRATATITNLGRLDLARFSGGGFRCTGAFVIPPAQPDLPLLLALVGHEGGLDLTAAGPVSREALSELLADLASDLTAPRSA